MRDPSPTRDRTFRARGGDRYAGSEAGFSSQVGFEGQRGATVRLVFSLNFCEQFNTTSPDAAGGGERSRAAGGGDDLGSHHVTRGDRGIRRELRFRTDPAAPAPQGPPARSALGPQNPTCPHTRRSSPFLLGQQVLQGHSPGLLSPGGLRGAFGGGPSGHIQRGR